MSGNNIYVSISDEGGSYFIVVDDVKYKCSYSESVLLSSLLKNKGTFYTKEQLAEIGWPNKLVSKNSVPVAIANIRKILKNHTKQEVITNEKNKGYSTLLSKVKFVENSAEKAPPLSGAEPVSSQGDLKSNTADFTEKTSKKVEQTEPLATSSEKTTTSHTLKELLSTGLGFPLLAINLLIALFVYFNNDIPPTKQEFEVINGKEYVAIYTGEPEFLSLLFGDNNNIVRKNVSALNIEDMLKIEIKNNKHVLFINNIDDRVIVDCLVKDELFSYSGDDISAIVDELKSNGCHI